MEANYHTHTVRCHHATGTEREYVEQAVSRKLKVLGFSDHSPQVYDNYVSGCRMLPEELENYVMTLRELREEYADRLELLIGLEAEYYPKYFNRLLNLIHPFQLDYLILGQHFVGNEEEGFPHCTISTDQESQLERFVKQVIEGLETGAFSCIAHPDVFNFTGDRRTFRKWYEKLCVRAKELGIPIEMNMLGYVTNRHYPGKEFFRIVREVGNEVILGCDAHEPGRVADPEEIERCMGFLKECGIEKVLTRMELVKP